MGKIPFEFDELNNLKKDITKIFDNFFEHTDSRIVEYDFIPPVDVIEKKDKIMIEVEIPGVDKEDIDLSFNNGILTIKGIKKPRINEEEDLFHRIERNYGKFHRRVPIPYDIDSDKVTAEFKKGVLYITLLKKHDKNDKKINIIYED